MLHIKNNNK